jgi:hypothetical protein
VVLGLGPSGADDDFVGVLNGLKDASFTGI